MFQSVSERERSAHVNLTASLGNVRTALLAVILITTILGQQGKVDNLADIKLARGSSNGDGIGISSGT